MKRRYTFFIALLFIAAIIFARPGMAQVSIGLDNLIDEHFAPLKGRHVGLITNQTGRTRNGELAADVFIRQRSFTLVALFAPEHGILGTRPAGVPSDTPEQYQGIPVYSLYGSTRKPTKAMLRGINTLVFDIQDAGVRPYTYVSTMVNAMEAAAEQGIAFYVLDRPDPLSGDRIEGNVLDPSLKSFVGVLPVPYLHGMTLGELAMMAKAKGWFNKAAKLNLTVIPMHGWKRSMYWMETGLNWIAPSPNVPAFPNDVGLAMLGATGELGNLSVGVGSDRPFTRIGSTLIERSELLRIATLSFPPSLTLSSEDYTATTSAGTKTYHGVNIDFPATLSSVSNLYEPQFQLLENLLKDTAFRASFDALPASVNTMFEKVTGMHGLLDSLKRCEDLRPIFESWKQDDNNFRKEREPFLLYH